jgi:hypothetical protein
MKITARVSGGFAGRSQEVELDTGCHADGAAIEALLQRLDFFDAAAPARAVGADLRRWEITADDGQRCRTVVLAEDGAPPGGAASGAGWQALIAHLQGRA